MSKETELVLVETVSLFRMRYVIEVPKGQTDWALDTVVCNEASEFSQEHLDETIVSRRIVTQKEALELCDIDNAYCKDWPKKKKIETFITPWKEQDGNQTH